MRIYRIRQLNGHPVEEAIQTVGERNLMNLLNTLPNQEIIITIIDRDMAIVGDASHVVAQLEEWLRMSLAKENVHFGAQKED